MAAQRPRGGKAGLVGQVVAKEHRARADHLLARHHPAHRLALVPARQAQFDQVLAVLDLERMDFGQVHRQRFGRLARLGRAAPMKAHAERLFLHQAARPGARQRVEIAGHVFQHRRSLGPRPDIVPAIFQPMAAGHRQGLGNRPECGRSVPASGR
jgi:hypothetical protein